ncbi:protein translocase subunit SecD [Candidatus Rhabdochlamydia porcellionis]|jgi:SecD/SecF fusion protein|uniref:Protein-export membrane protein SecF n=1 Tax=Candidatus Rhabdochlamydia porcellionis TaxID=225148 RepID=A0ABX8YZ03_9BACT|nr:protein translocase subunit SecD [Candidatus Rhabdochlamydia porcellionis]QZA58273.1 Protein translocase subunit SecD [Candidatus Rhabdochlamydia porcellionis]
MKKQKKWQLYLIFIVIALTVYNILPTVFYYSKPLQQPIEEKRAEQIAVSISERVNQLEEEAEKWLHSFCNLLEVKPQTIALDARQPQIITISFKNTEEANLFRTYLPRAGQLIPFLPAQLFLHEDVDTNSRTVIVQRRIPIHFDALTYYQFSRKWDSLGKPTPFYEKIVQDRALQIASSIAGSTQNALYLQNALKQTGAIQEDQFVQIAKNILSFTNVYGESSLIAERYFASFTQCNLEDRQGFMQSWIQRLETLQEKLLKEKEQLQNKSAQAEKTAMFLTTLEQQRLESLSDKTQALKQATQVIKKHLDLFMKAKNPLSYEDLQKNLTQDHNTQTIALEGYNPFIKSIFIELSQEKIFLDLYEDIEAMREKGLQPSYLEDQADQLMYNEIAFIARSADEIISPFQGRFEIRLNQLSDSKSFLAMDLGQIAHKMSSQVKETLLRFWHPIHPDLQRNALPIYDYDTYKALPLAEQKLALVVYAPASYAATPVPGFRSHSIYVVAKGMDKILSRLQNESHSAQTNQFIQDFNQLREILQKSGFVDYPTAGYAFDPEFSQDLIFEQENYYQILLKSTRENFKVSGTKRFAILEFTNLEQRLLTENKIFNQIHEDLLKWRDDYFAAQNQARGVTKYDVPKPVHNIYWNNFCLSLKKYFRGDNRKILHWGLDLSGGKTVQLELVDHNGKTVIDPIDIKQGINELYARVNKMGISEVNIRQEGNTIALDFPGAQGLSASDLVKSSSMCFQIVNEKFSPNNIELADATQKFLQEIWNEAVVTNCKDIEDIYLIASKHLYGDSLDSKLVQPRSESAKTLYENGLRFALNGPINSNFNETYSKIAMLRGSDFTSWNGQTHPLLIVFRNFALEGSNLENIHASYDPSKGNFLAFSVKGSFTDKSGNKQYPRDNLLAWTSQFSKEKIQGTDRESFSAGRGWRMAVILNGSVISSPTLDSELKDSGMITGSFTQREISQLEADLKAGSLSFTPHVLAEKNVSPELGVKERMQGIVATMIALCLVIAAMVSYYRFGGMIASIAVIFNLLILWGTLQNLQATLSLAGIAGIILTVGMAVDANVLVFERIREEFQTTGRIAMAIHAGYRKAFSAILDSNITTIIAALVLLNFDSGPIKAFAITMIIGIISSMFTALFMTRFFFSKWIENPNHKKLNMLNWFKTKDFNFFKYAKPALFLSFCVILIGSFMLVTQRNTIFGMDFRGGYALIVELTPDTENNYRYSVEKALTRAGATNNEVQIRELTPNNQVRIFLSRSLQEEGHPFANLPLEYTLKESNYPYQTNPKIVWVVQSLEKSGLSLTPSSLQSLNKQWTEVSGQLSDTMRNNALIGISIAMLCILIYITIRFEFNYAISAILCLAHDLFFTLSAIAILHKLHVPIQIDLNTIAALMTIIGYSLNDTIIVFDRIREDMQFMRKMSLIDIMNHALNVTLSRTLMTSGTTLLVLVPLLFLGGSTLFGFSLVMVIGVIFGTLSSLFIAAPLMKFFYEWELQKLSKMKLNER